MHEWNKVLHIVSFANQKNVGNRDAITGRTTEVIDNSVLADFAPHRKVDMRPSDRTRASGGDGDVCPGCSRISHRHPTHAARSIHQYDHSPWKGRVSPGRRYNQRSILHDWCFVRQRTDGTACTIHLGVPRRAECVILDVRETNTGAVTFREFGI